MLKASGVVGIRISDLSLSQKIGRDARASEDLLRRQAPHYPAFAQAVLGDSLAVAIAPDFFGEAANLFVALRITGQAGCLGRRWADDGCSRFDQPPDASEQLRGHGLRF